LFDPHPNLDTVLAATQSPLRSRPTSLPCLLIRAAQHFLAARLTPSPPCTTKCAWLCMPMCVPHNVGVGPAPYRRLFACDSLRQTMSGAQTNPQCPLRIILIFQFIYSLPSFLPSHPFEKDSSFALSHFLLCTSLSLNRFSPLAVTGERGVIAREWTPK
jgi:hypothetical protein